MKFIKLRNLRYFIIQLELTFQQHLFKGLHRRHIEGYESYEIYENFEIDGNSPYHLQNKQLQI